MTTIMVRVHRPLRYVIISFFSDFAWTVEQTGKSKADVCMASSGGLKNIPVSYFSQSTWVEKKCLIAGIGRLRIKEIFSPS